MKILSTKLDKNNVIFTVELDSNQWSNAYSSAKNVIAKNIQIPGFRKGHVPTNIIDDKVDPIAIGEKAINKLQSKLIDSIIQTNEFKNSKCLDSCIGIQILKFDANHSSPQLNFTFELKPTIINFDAKDLKNISIPVFKQPDISDSFIEQQIKLMTRNDAMISAKTTKIEMGDLAIIDFQGFIDDKPFENGSGTNYELEIGSKTFIDNFEQQLIGLKINDQKDINVTFPLDYNKKSLAGKKAIFKVNIKNVKKIQYPELTPEYLAKFKLPVKTKKQLEDHLKNLFFEEAQIHYQESVMKIVNDKINKDVKISYYPQTLMNYYRHHVLEKYESEARQAGYSNIDAYKKALNVSDEKFNQTLNESTISSLKLATVYEMLINEYKITVTDDDVKKHLVKLTQYFKDEKKANEVYKNNPNYVNSLIINQKLVNKIINECNKK